MVFSQLFLNLEHFEPKYSPSNIKTNVPVHADYQELHAKLGATIAANDGKQPGDVQKCVRRMVDFVRSKGMARGHTLPVRLPLGKDCLMVMKQKCWDTLKLCEEWEDVITSCEIDEGTPGTEGGKDA